MTSRKSKMPIIVAGQRWTSEAEPELGLGTVVDVDERNIALVFPAADETRRYAISSAPLRRTKFAPGDIVTTRDNRRVEIQSVDEEDGLLRYVGEQFVVSEADLSDRIAITGPRERMLAGRTDSLDAFVFRAETSRRLRGLRESSVRGFVGARVDLLHHQFYIASEVAERRLPRVLLADETGLGKTIEACLIINRLLLTGRAARVLILVPDPLIHQWLVELRRRFSLLFSVYDSERIKATRESSPDANPFEDEQLVLAATGLFRSQPELANDAGDAGWDLVVVDEAHHLAWSPDLVSPEYQAVETVSQNSAGLLLLSATPEQLGEHGHFARLRLLDPERFTTFERWTEESETYAASARLADRLTNKNPLDDELRALLAKVIGVSVDETDAVIHDDARRHAALDALVDRHGPGRVMFRNTRSAVEEFPERNVGVDALPCPDSVLPNIQVEVSADLQATNGDPVYTLTHDPRISWLLDTIKSTGDKKLLIICTSAAKATALKDEIEHHVRIDIALFHEEFSLVQRDRNAAWFADPDGARVMICSEIGSEGRNFQHAHHLIMFDLPIDPDLVEQRIGRLDRIGQKHTVQIHVARPRESAAEVLVGWHHDGLGALEQPVRAGAALLEFYGDDLSALADQWSSSDPKERRAELETLSAEASETASRLTEKIEGGRDRLLEISSLRRDVAEALVSKIEAADANSDIEEFFLRLLEVFHVYSEEIGPRTYLINPDTIQSTDFPTLSRGKTAMAFDRATALVREDVDFGSVDHPLLSDAMELLLASEKGNACFSVIGTEGGPRIAAEAVFVLEPIAPRHLHVDRFLAPTPIFAATDQNLEDLSEDLGIDRSKIERGRSEWLVEQNASVRQFLRKMIKAMEQAAETKALPIRNAAAEVADRTVRDETDRLKKLAEVNDQVRPEEIQALEVEREKLVEHIENARIRLDSIHLIWVGPTDDGMPVFG